MVNASHELVCVIVLDEEKKKCILIESYAILKNYVIPFNSFYVTVFGMVRCYIKENEKF